MQVITTSLGGGFLSRRCNLVLHVQSAGASLHYRSLLLQRVKE